MKLSKANNEFAYIGNELTLFEQAKNWKKYYYGYFRFFLKSSVCEVGAGIGGTTKYLCDGSQTKWICIEPDKDLCDQIKERIRNGGLPKNCEAYCGTLGEYDSHEKFNAILYIDVIEHIEDDKKELNTADSKIVSGGYLIIIVPAFQFLYNDFDKAIGHFRRYNRNKIMKAMPSGYDILQLKYLDSAGFLASLLNKYLLKQQYPTMKQVRSWDRILVRLSKILDRVFFFKVGKSLLVIARKN